MGVLCLLQALRDAMREGVHLYPLRRSTRLHDRTPMWCTPSRLSTKLKLSVPACPVFDRTLPCHCRWSLSIAAYSKAGGNHILRLTTLRQNSVPVMGTSTRGRAGHQSARG